MQRPGFRVTLAAGLSAFCVGLSFPAMGEPQPGQIIVDPDNPAWFKYAGGGPFFMSGPGDPEDFLYRGTRNANGTRNGDQMALINKMIGTGANCIYLMAIRSHGGDGDSTHNPFVGFDPTNSINHTILDQWDTWFTAMDNAGIVIFFFFYDDSSRPFGKELPAGGQLKPEEVTFIDTMVSRFKQYKHLIWCVAEEYAEGLSAAHAIKIAERIKFSDDRRHPVAIHQNHGTSFNFNGNPAFDQFAVQWNVPTVAQLHAGTVAAWNNVQGKININMSEFAPLSTGLELQRRVWAIAMGGGYSMVLYMDIASTPLGDLQTCGRLVRFMEATRFNEAAPNNALALLDAEYALAAPGEVYLAYSSIGGTFGLAMLPGNYVVKWYDPANGNWIDQGLRAVAAPGAEVFVRPGAIAGDAALYVSSTAPTAAGNPYPSPGAIGVSAGVQLSWTPGIGAVSRNVYFGTTSPGELRGNQTGTTFDPGTLELNTRYYWRIDEINAQGVNAGPVWSFVTEGIAADYDGDGDVDLDDFGAFQLCFSSVGVSGPAPGCDWADFNRDGIVDQADSALFIGCLSAPGVPADSACLAQ